MGDDNKIEKKIISAPSLPNVIAGDGRVVMSLLKSFMEQLSMQVNLANGFSAEEIKPESGGYPTPRNFYLTFNRVGGYLSWDRLLDESELEYYETRFNRDFGNEFSLLDRTRDNWSYRVPVSYVGSVYLWAVKRDGSRSNYTVINYSKSRPDMPRDISLVKNEQGTLITFLEIPTNCIGANIYVNEYEQIQTLDNLYLYQHDKDFVIKTVEVAYYDNFGEGERGILYTQVPDVQNFVVERNGPYFDFYWDALNIYNIQYTVRIAQSPDWELGLEIFKTKLNKHRWTYPAAGDYYFLIKAVDEHNNFSVNAAYMLTRNVDDISKNIILSFVQQDSFYAGNKINMYYDYTSNALKLDRQAPGGEYIMQVELPQRYRARNWIEYRAIGVTNSSVIWSDLDFTWNSDEAKKLTWTGYLGDLSKTKIGAQIATYFGAPVGATLSIPLDGNLKTDAGGDPSTKLSATNFQDGRWGKGLMIGDFTQLAYQIVSGTRVFGLSFRLKKTTYLQETVLMTLTNGNGSYFILWYKNNEFRLVCSDGHNLSVGLVAPERDWLTFGISQGDGKRKLFVHSLGLNKVFSDVVEAAPLSGVFNTIYYHARVVFN